MKISQKQAEEVANNMQTMMSCFVHKESREIHLVPEEEMRGVADIDDWLEQMDHIRDHPNQYWQIEKMSSRESFKVMERFVDQIDGDQLDDKRLKFALYDALSKPGPFRNFRHIIHGAGKFKDEWFAFKQQELEADVIAQFELLPD